MNRAVPSEPEWHLKISASKLLFNVSHFSCQVCREGGQVPCVPLPCGSPSCRDSLTLSRSALRKAQEAEAMAHNLSNQVQGWKNQVNNVFSFFICKTVAILKKANYFRFYYKTAIQLLSKRVHSRHQVFLCLEIDDKNIDVDMNVYLFFGPLQNEFVNSCSIQLDKFSWFIILGFIINTN